MQISLAPIIAGCIAIAALGFATPRAASATTAVVPAVEYGETNAGIVQQDRLSLPIRAAIGITVIGITAIGITAIGATATEVTAIGATATEVTAIGPTAITAVMAILTGAAPVSASGSVSNAAKY